MVSMELIVISAGDGVIVPQQYVIASGKMLKWQRNRVGFALNVVQYGRGGKMAVIYVMRMLPFVHTKGEHQALPTLSFRIN